MNSDPKDNVANEAANRLNQDLRTGLNDIIGCAALLESHADERDRESLRQILRASRQMLDLIGGNFLQPESKAVPKNGLPKTALQNVLYIEDNDANFALVSRILEDRVHINLVQADCGEVGLKLAAEIHPRLILLDLNLPGIHGSEVLYRLRQKAETEAIPVVVISADATSSQIERLLAAGARNYLTKPFSIEMLLAVIDDILPEIAEA